MRWLISTLTVSGAFVLVVLGSPAFAQAQWARPDVQGAKNGMSEAEIERSREIQTELARIERDKDAFISELIKSWMPALDNGAYADPAAELMPLMQAATPWQLYGASLVGDFRAMVHTLTGKVGAGRYVNALTGPQPKAVSDGSLELLGATTGDLVFTPIPPCRMVDTRNVGARTGLLNLGAPRVFDLTTGGFSKGQGGSTSCPGLPSFSNFGWSANVTVTGYANNGGLKAYPFGGAEPATSIINYFPAAYAIANSSTLTGCFGCGDDVTFLAFGAPTHLIVDVMGYYEVATGFASGAVTRLAGTTETVAAGVYTSVFGASCPAGTVVIGGAQTNSSSSSNTILTSDHSISGTQWYEYVKNTGSSSATVTVFSICMDLS